MHINNILVLLNYFDNTENFFLKKRSEKSEYLTAIFTFLAINKAI